MIISLFPAPSRLFPLVKTSTRGMFGHQHVSLSKLHLRHLYEPLYDSLTTLSRFHRLPSLFGSPVMCNCIFHSYADSFFSINPLSTTSHIDLMVPHSLSSVSPEKRWNGMRSYSTLTDNRFPTIAVQAIKSLYQFPNYCVRGQEERHWFITPSVTCHITPVPSI